MTNNTLLESLHTLLGTKIVASEILHDTLVIEVTPNEAFNAIQMLKNDADL